MTKTIFTAKLPNGGTATRTSSSLVYTHAVVSGQRALSWHTTRILAESGLRQAQRWHTEAKVVPVTGEEIVKKKTSAADVNATRRGVITRDIKSWQKALTHVEQRLATWEDGGAERLTAQYSQPIYRMNAEQIAARVAREDAEVRRSPVVTRERIAKLEQERAALLAAAGKGGDETPPPAASAPVPGSVEDIDPEADAIEAVRLEGVAAPNGDVDPEIDPEADAIEAVRLEGLATLEGSTTLADRENARAAWTLADEVAKASTEAGVLAFTDEAWLDGRIDYDSLLAVKGEAAVQPRPDGYRVTLISRQDTPRGPLEQWAWARQDDTAVGTGCRTEAEAWDRARAHAARRRQPQRLAVMETPEGHAIVEVEGDVEHPTDERSRTRHDAEDLTIADDKRPQRVVIKFTRKDGCDWYSLLEMARYDYAAVVAWTRDEFCEDRRLRSATLAMRRHDRPTMARWASFMVGAYHV